MGISLPRPTTSRDRVHELRRRRLDRVGRARLYFFSRWPTAACYRGGAGAAATDHGGQGLSGTPMGSSTARPRSVDRGCAKTHSAPGEPINTLVSIDPLFGSANGDLLRDTAFYSSPAALPGWRAARVPGPGTTPICLGDGQRAFLCPAGGGVPAEVAGGPRRIDLPAGVVARWLNCFYISDRTGWWNLFSRTGQAGLRLWEAEFRRWAAMGIRHVPATPSPAHAASSALIGRTASGGLAIVDLDNTGRPDKRSRRPTRTFRTVRGGRRRRGVSWRAPPSDTRVPSCASIWPPGRCEVLKKSTTVADDPALARYFHAGWSRSDTRLREVAPAFGLYYPRAQSRTSPAPGRDSLRRSW